MTSKHYHAEHKRLLRLLDALANGEAERHTLDSLEGLYPIYMRDDFTVILPETN